MIEKFKELVNNNIKITDSKVLVGVSGGVDSVVLCDLFFNLKVNFGIGHCNFGLRGIESDEDENFVEKLSQKYSVDFFKERFILPNGGNIQNWARDSRYRWFEKIRSENGFSKIAVAHHLDDNLETVLINFTRGTGLEGLVGMKFEKGNIIRPLLNFSKRDILDYATRNNLKWQEDSSNKSSKYLRNNLRNNIIPNIKNLNRDFLGAFKNTLENLNHHQNFYSQKISEEISKIKENYPNAIFSIDIDKLKKSGHSKLILYEILKKYGFSKMLDNILKSIDKISGKEFFDNGFRLLKDREKIILTEERKHRDELIYIPENTKKIEKPLRIKFDKIDADQTTYDKNSKSVFLDYDKLKFPLVLRKWKEGDYFYPLGMDGKKKLSKFFKDNKLSKVEKDNIWVLCSDNNVVWIVGMRISNRYRVVEVTKKVYISSLF